MPGPVVADRIANTELIAESVFAGKNVISRSSLVSIGDSPLSAPGV
jgi:hypothetical protein